MAKRVNGNGNDEIKFRVLQDLEDIPEIIRPKRDSRYQTLIKAILEHPNTPIEFWNGSVSGLRNAIKRELPPDVAVQIVVAERRKNGRKHKYALYDTKGEYVKKKRTVKPD